MGGEGDAQAARGAAPHGWAQEAEDLVRAASGGVLVGVPLLYTTEVWSIGSNTSGRRMIVVLAVTFIGVLALNLTCGFRSTRDVSVAEAVMDTVDALALGIVCVTVILILFQEITLQTSMRQILGKVIYQVTPFAIGIGLASHFLQGDDASDDGESSDGQINPTVADIGATLMGSVIIALAIAPTDEVRILASAMNPRWTLGLIALTLVISYAIVFEAGFTAQSERRSHPGLLQNPLSETVVSYLVALIAAMAMLWFFQRVGEGEPWQVTLDHAVVLGFPAAIGGAAGRLAV